MRFVLSCCTAREYQRNVRKGTHGSSPDSSFWLAGSVHFGGWDEAGAFDNNTLTLNCMFSVLNSVELIDEAYISGPLN